MQDLTNTYEPTKAITLKNRLEYFRNIKTFIFDVDGVLTDGKVLVTEGGEHLRSYHARDGYAIRHALDEGYNVCIITGGSGGSVEERMKKLKVPHYYVNATDKLPILQNYCAAHGIKTEEILYMGDDLNDFSVMQKVGLPCCPFDACNEIIGLSHYISPFKGGEGCVRDVIEKVMKLRGNWMSHISVSG